MLIHEKGDCTTPNATRVGKVFPIGKAMDRPAGEMPPVKADEKGQARGSFRIAELNVGKDWRETIQDKAMVITSTNSPSPTAHMACGVIRAPQAAPTEIK